MTIIIATIIIAIFLFLSGIHIYWALGGRWGSSAVIPTKDNTIKAVLPGFIPTMVVSMGLLSCAFVVLMNTVEFPFQLHPRFDLVLRYGLWTIAGVFFLRAIGEFNYVGFFKKYKHTVFGQKDTMYYSPLCLIIAVLTILLALNK